jgi:hypothetical protein
LLPEETRQPVDVAHNLIFRLGAVVLSPLPVLGLLVLVHHSLMKRKLVVPAVSCICFLLFASYLGLNAWCLHLEGRAALNPVFYNTWVLATELRDGELRYVASSGGWTGRVLSLGLDTPDATPQGLAVVSKESPGDLSKAYLKGEKLVLFVPSKERKIRRWRVATYKLTDKPELIKQSVVEMPGYFHGLRELSDEQVAFRLYDYDSDRSAWWLIDLRTGEIEETADPRLPDEPGTEFESGNRRYRVLGEPHVRWPRLLVIVEDRNLPRGSEPSATVPYLYPIAADGHLLAGLDLPDPDKPWRDARLRLYDTSSIQDMKMVQIHLPYRFLGAYNSILFSLRSLGYSIIKRDVSSLRFPYLDITLGGGYLCVWAGQPVGRVAVWEVKDPSSPRFLGIAACPNLDDFYRITGDGLSSWATTPILRPDGALGFLVERRGILWLEFPELMKGKSS